MKEEILICTIFRDREKFVDRWFEQIKSIINYYNKYEFSISIYENDSGDKTVEKIQSLDKSLFKKFIFFNETINTNYYPSIINEDRVKNLALARNKCLDNLQINLFDYKKILFIEPDFRYTLGDAKKIISSEEIHNKNFDIISGISLYNGQFYDSWATRKTCHDNNGNATHGNKLEEYWSTFNGFCLYNAQPFKENIRFHWINKRKNMYDCDTVVICENFRENDYKNIFIDCSAVFHHES